MNFFLFPSAYAMLYCCIFFTLVWNQTCSIYEVHLYTLCLNTVINSFKYISRNEIAGLYDNSVQPIERQPSCFSQECSIFLSSRQCMTKSPNSSTPSLTLVISLLAVVMANLLGVNCDLTVVCI